MLIRTQCISFFKGKERASWHGNFADLWKTTLYIVSTSTKWLMQIKLLSLSMKRHQSSSTDIQESVLERQHENMPEHWEWQPYWVLVSSLTHFFFLNHFPEEFSQTPKDWKKLKDQYIFTYLHTSYYRLTSKV